MKLTNFITFGAAVAMAMVPVAASYAQSATADYLVVRDGKVVSLSADKLAMGDRVVTRGSEGTKLQMASCALDVPAASTVTIGANACDSSVKSLQVSRATANMQDASSIHGAGWLVALLALAAIIAGAAIAAGGTNTPTSP